MLTQHTLAGEYLKIKEKVDEQWHWHHSDSCLKVVK